MTRTAEHPRRAARGRKPHAGPWSKWTIGWGAACVAALGAVAAAGCGPSEEEVQRLADARIAAALTALPTPTPIRVPTQQPLSELIAAALTAVPTPTPIRVPTLLPTSTPHPIPDFGEVYRSAFLSVFYIETSRGHGSGWLVEPGFILTNHHVVENATQVRIRQASGAPFQATVVGRDSRRDIALLAFDARTAPLDKDAQPLPLGDITTQDVARPLLALGYSGESGVKGDGSVGAAGANAGILSQITDFGTNGPGRNLEMDVPVDPGDSGGPVLDSTGMVVGMNRAADLQTATGQRMVGTFYAVHVEEVRRALPDLKAGRAR